MAVDGVSGSGGTSSLRDAASVARTSAIAAAAATRARIEGYGTAAPVPGWPFSPTVTDENSDSSGSSSSTSSSASTGGGLGGGLGGAVSAFIAQLLGQSGSEGDGSSSVSSAIRAAVDAYAGASRGGQGAASAGLSEVILPFGAPLASGHAIDLSV